MNPAIDQIDMPCDGAGNRNRTYHLLVTNGLLYRLSYIGKKEKRSFCIAWATPAFQDLYAFLIHLIQKWRYSRRWRRHEDSNLGAAFAASRFSKPAPSAAWVCLHWSEWQDSNLRSHAPKARVLPNCTTFRMVAGAGLEPAPSGL